MRAIAAVLCLAFTLSGCAVYEVGSTAVGAATTVAGTAVDAAGTVVSGAAGAVSGGRDEKR